MDMDFEVNMNEYLPLRDVVFNTLRKAILRGELKPGERLMEIQLANKLGVSRTPIREAIRKLELEILIYNSTIDGELQTMDQLLQKSDLLKNFKAVQEGRVWCTGKNLFQESLGLGDLIADIHTIVTAEDGESLDLTYLHPLS